MALAKSAIAAIGVVGEIALAILCLPCIAGLMYFGGRRGCVRHSSHRRPKRHSSSPRKPRIDISQRPPTEQPRSCRLLNLPLEVRQCIYEQALGGRVVCFHFVSPYKIRSACYEAVDYPSVNLQKLDMPADSLDTALLRTCRQIYLEARPILYQRNTFYFTAHDLEATVLFALGTHCLPDIRSVHLYHTYRQSQFVPPWAAIFPLLQQMRLTHLVFQFELDNRLLNGHVPWFNSHVDVLEGTWAQSVLGIRNLYQFGLFFEGEEGPQDLGYRTQIAEGLRELMIGTRADERYKKFLEARGQKRAD
ncbi:hypothetical protein DFH06DRAFT_4708 [Mycena polygramma]|nr:hypothetical protein DFH06DRAFT_4708 [Mycena polygramma]